MPVYTKESASGPHGRKRTYPASKISKKGGGPAGQSGSQGAVRTHSTSISKLRSEKELLQHKSTYVPNRGMKKMPAEKEKSSTQLQERASR